MTGFKMWCCVLVVGLAVILTAGIASAQETSTEADTEAAESAVPAEEAQPDTSLADLLRSLETPVEEAAGRAEGGFISRVKESGLVELFQLVFKVGKHAVFIVNGNQCIPKAGQLCDQVVF